jgi:LAO/AO transport system kinase
MQKHDSQYYIKGILNSDMAILSRAITLVESQQLAHQELAQEIMEGVISKSGKSFRIGITGVPGVGKSTFIESFGKEVVAQGYKLAVLAVDPSSTISKGSILGDKTRMEELSVLKNVYIRPSPSSGNLGGVTRSTYETILLCEAAGYDFILVETVGVGQSEVAVSKITDFFLLLMLAGAGDELQGIKRGIMEMANAVVITKADGDNLNHAKTARSEYAHALHMLQAHESGWTTRTLICSAIENTGIAEVYRMIDEYKRFTNDSGYFDKNRNAQQFELFLNSLDEQLRTKFYSNPSLQQKIVEIKHEKMIQPFSLAKKIIKEFYK